MKEFVMVTFSNGEVWRVPVETIASHRANHFMNVDGVDFETSYDEDTVPLFTSSTFEIIDWFQNNMEWSDVVEDAELFDTVPQNTAAELWPDADMEVV